MTTDRLPRSIGMWGGAAIMVGVMIGSGIFRTPVSIANDMGDPRLILLLWAAGGALCLLGAFTYAELTTMFPKSGGVYVFLYEGFGPVVAFVFGWTYFLVTQPMALGGLATVFAEHLVALLKSDPDTPLIGFTTDRPVVLAVTCVTILGLTAVNVTGMKRGAGIAVALTVLKTIALAAIVVAAAALMKGDSANFTPLPSPKPFWVALAPAMAAILWTYDGWSDVSAVAEEVRQPQRRIPQIFFVGTVGITLLYLAVNAVYIWLIPLPEMARTFTVAPLVMEKVIGSGGAIVAAALIMLSVLGCTHGSIIVGSRVVFAQARDRLLFGFLGRVNPRFQTPAIALWGQALLACTVTLWLKRFEALMAGFVLTMWIFYGLGAAAVIVLRLRRPGAERPYRCWGYPVVPILFILAAIFMTGLGIYDSALQTIVSMAVLLAGVPAYYVWRRFFRPVAAHHDSSVMTVQ